MNQLVAQNTELATEVGNDFEFIEIGPRAKDMRGKRIGRLVVLGPIGHSRWGRIAWLCRCDCGTIKRIDGDVLRRNTVLSCGCYNREITSIANTRHGLRHKPIYRIWYQMVQRCHNPNDKAWRYYGARGIHVCAEWRESSSAFFGYVTRLAHYNEPGYSLDRIDNYKGYEEGNIRWATAKQQANNRRNSKEKMR